MPDGSHGQRVICNRESGLHDRSSVWLTLDAQQMRVMGGGGGKREIYTALMLCTY